MPAAILQIDAPDCVRLSGDVLEGYRALARNEFLEEPWERALEGGQIRDRVAELPAPIGRIVGEDPERHRGTVAGRAATRSTSTSSAPWSSACAHDGARVVG